MDGIQRNTVSSGNFINIIRSLKTLILNTVMVGEKQVYTLWLI